MEKKDGHGTVPYNRWLHQHDEDIMSEFQDRLTADMAGECGVNYYTVSRRAARLGVQKSEEFMHTRRKKGGIRKGSKRTKYKMSSDEYMKAHFHDTANAELAEMFGVDVKTVRRWARRLGLQKSEEFMQAVRGKRRKGYYTDEYKAMRNKRIAEVYPEASEEQLMQLAEELGIKLDVLRGLAYRIGVRRSSKRVAESMRRGIDTPIKVLSNAGKPFKVGYAGGINPDNVADKLAYLLQHDEVGDFWIDMESGVRTDDWFDTDKVRRVLAICKGVIRNLGKED